MLHFQLDSDVCSADLHHNPRKHVGLHAPQRLHRLPTCASLRTVSVVVRACGFHGWSSWLGTCSPCSGAVRASSQSRAALLTRPPVSRINGMKLSWSAYHGTCRCVPSVRIMVHVYHWYVRAIGTTKWYYHGSEYTCTILD